ncbi:MAG: nucleotidyltransferase family protein [Clostridia bacterium]|nr:nucleotidyltransferase family protein [Clostridia bacterium]
MNCTAIICEYNPFHNGHKYLIEEARRISGSNYIIAVMSGNYMQRGGPAVTDKWTRARIAIECGADAVIEIPSVFSSGSAQFFAEAAVDLINKTGVVDYIAFGSETADIDRLKTFGETRAKEPEKFREILKSMLKDGNSYSTAMEKALGTRLKSNDILAVEYISALYKTNSAVTPVIIKRAGSAEHTDSVLPSKKTESGSSSASSDSSASFASASALRKILSQHEEYTNCNSKAYNFMPENASALLRKALTAQGGSMSLENFSQIIFYELRRLKPEGIRALPYVSEGFEYKLYEAACKTGDIDSLTDFCTSSRYTKTRVTRILTAILTGATAKSHEAWRNNLPYIKILGFKRSSAELISVISEKAHVPVIIQPAKAMKTLSESAKLLLGLEYFATDNYVLGFGNSSMQNAGQEFTRKSVII